MSLNEKKLINERDAARAEAEALRRERDELDARLAEIEQQEPVAFVLRSTKDRLVPWVVKHRRSLSASASALVGSGADHLDPLYASPAPAAEPVLLSDEQVVDAYRQPFDGLMDHIYEYGTVAEGSEYYAIKMARAIEAAVLIVNGMMVGDAPAQAAPADGCGACGDACKSRGSCRLAEESPQAELTSCQADRDGDCSHPACPQRRDGEPHATGRSCPLGAEGGAA